MKSQPQSIHGSRHIFKYILWIRGLPKEVQAIIRPVIINNAYYCHPENILLSMITDEEQEIRELGYEKIRIARNDPPPILRQFIIPKENINFECNYYVEMIDWNSVRLTEPPSIQFLSDNQIQCFQYSSTDIINIPGNVHTYI